MPQTKLKQVQVQKTKFEHLNQAIPPEAHTPMYNIHRFFNEPAIKEIVDKFEWKIINFDSLRMFFNKTKANKTIDLEGFDDLLKLPRESIEEQKTLKKL